jgi:hypothetical protein
MTLQDIQRWSRCDACERWRALPSEAPDYAGEVVFKCNMLKEGTCETAEQTCDGDALLMSGCKQGCTDRRQKKGGCAASSQADGTGTNVSLTASVPAAAVGTGSTASRQRQHYERVLDTMMWTFEMLATAAQESEKKSQDRQAQLQVFVPTNDPCSSL